ncbi:hypothetical protein LOK49_LG01G01496 [Camellia lanceoleosa]|uniref:Uncharacterized protein n=1 Tax=Camellia lanceoleosa TaxID=1840588 RepID=A0ACC0J0P9_9ERIC|nr:hypothetical protein LOK49_LG01G01496 [Camellia lanceoleosa]
MRSEYTSINAARSGGLDDRALWRDRRWYMVDREMDLTLNNEARQKKLHLSLQQYQLLNKAHKTRYASKSSHNIHKTSLKDNSKNARSDRNVVKGAWAARIQQNKW